MAVAKLQDANQHQPQVAGQMVAGRALRHIVVLEELHDGESKGNQRARRPSPAGLRGLESHAGIQAKWAWVFSWGRDGAALIARSHGRVRMLICFGHGGRFHLNSTSARICAQRMRRSIVNGYTVAYATVGASDFVMLVANAKAGGSVTLPASRPVSTA